MFCSNCGNRIPEGGKFCRNCGAAANAVRQESEIPPFLPYSTDTVPEMEPVPKETAAAPAATLEEPVAPARKKKKLLVLTLMLAVAVTALVAAVLLLGKKTVYLATEIVSESMNGPVTTQRYEYDDAGRITKYEYEMAYPSNMSSIRTALEISYEYDDDGKLESAAFSSNGETIEVEYIYKKGVLDGFELESSAYRFTLFELDVECDDEGRFEYIGFLDGDGDEYSSWEFQYHDNGVIRESSQFQSLYNMETVSRFNEDGQTVETFTYWNDAQQFRYVYDYDEAGRQTLVEVYNGAEELELRYEIEYAIKGKKQTGFTLQIESMGDNGETLEAKLTFECKWDGRECTMTVAEIDGDVGALERFGFADEDIEITLKKDRHGNTVKQETVVGGDTLTCTATEYASFRVSRKYIAPNVHTDPLYLFFLRNM